MLLDTRPLIVSTTLAALLWANGCAKDPAKEVPAAQVAEPQVEAAAAQPAAAPAAEPAPAALAVAAPAALAAPAAAPAGLALTGSIAAIGSKVTGQHTLLFKTWNGSLQLKDGRPEGGALQFAVDVASVYSDPDNRNPFSEKLDGHLKSGDFFDADKNPKATFASDAITAGGQGGTHTIKGRLTLRGTTKEVTFPATIATAGQDVTGKAEFTINRKDFGLVYPGKPDDLIRDGVVLKMDLKATLP